MNQADVVVEGGIMTSSITKGAPVAVGGAVSSLSIFGIPVPDFVPILTCIYLVVMIGHTIWKWYHDYKTSKREEKECQCDKK